MLRNEKLKIGDHLFKWGERTYLMGIINLTPDSFSGDGLVSAAAEDNPNINITNLVQSSLDQATRFVKSGADILDVGGESTRPGAKQVDTASEMERVVPVIEAITRELDVPVSIDTYKHEVAQEALNAGAQMVNDIWGFHADSVMAETVARNKVPVILMHNH